MKDKLRELVDELMSACEMIGYATSGNERANHRATRDKIKAEILAILDAEGDGEAVKDDKTAEPDSAPTESGSFFQPSGSEPDQLPYRPRSLLVGVYLFIPIPRSQAFCSYDGDVTPLNERIDAAIQGERHER